MVECWAASKDWQTADYLVELTGYWLEYWKAATLECRMADMMAEWTEYQMVGPKDDKKAVSTAEKKARTMVEKTAIE